VGQQESEWCFSVTSYFDTCYLLHADFLFSLFFDPENGGNNPPKRLSTFSLLLVLALLPLGA
jgi:hypothetical protein